MIRRSSLGDRSLSVVTSALTLVRDAALDRALDPRNVSKGDWHALGWGELVMLLDEEVGELIAAVQRDEPIPRVLAEAGDVVWCVAMIVDWRRAR